MGTTLLQSIPTSCINTCRGEVMTREQVLKKIRELLKTDFDLNFLPAFQKGRNLDIDSGDKG